MTEVCFINIGPKQRRIRMISGMVFLVAGAGLVAGLADAGADRLWRLLVVPLLFVATVGYFQAHEKT